MNSFHTHQWSHHRINVIHVTNVYMRQLKDSKQLQPYYFAWKCRCYKGGVAGILNCLGNLLNASLCFASRLIIMD
jgi:hypothetical protein